MDWTAFDAGVKLQLCFDTLAPEVRSRWTPISPFSITAETRNHVKGFRVFDMRSNKSKRVATKREATRVAKMIEQDFYGQPK